MGLNTYIGVATVASKAQGATIDFTFLGTKVGAVASAIIPDVQMLVTFFQAIIVFIFAIGILMAYYLPLIPLITWVGAVLGYIMFLFEAFIGSIFWAGAHAMPEGHGVSRATCKTGLYVNACTCRTPLLNGGRLYWRYGAVGYFG